MFFTAVAGVFAQDLPLPEVSATIPAQTLEADADDSTIDLRDHFRFLLVEGVDGQIARFNTSFGMFDVELRPDWAPNHVVNFRTYVEEGRYDNTIIHRTAFFEDQETRAIVQGGGFTNGIPPAQLAAHDPVLLEIGQFNFRATLGAARTSDPDSATTGWYFNVIDNSETLGNDIFTGQIGFSVFGGMLGSGMDVVDAMADVETFNATGVYGGAFGELPLVDFEVDDGLPGAENFVTIHDITMVPHYPSEAGEAAALTFTATSSDPAVLAVSVVGSDLILNPLSAGTVTVTVAATDVRSFELNQDFAVEVEGAVAIAQQPVSQTIAPGGTAVFTVAAAGDAAVTYQWFKDGAALAGETGSSLTLTNIGTADNAAYSATLTDGDLVSTSRTAHLLAATPAPGRISNESVRTNVGAGRSLTVGFSLLGGDKSMLIRGVGPTLGSFGVPGILTTPELELFRIENGSTSLQTNAGWNGDADIAAAASSVGAFALQSNDDAAILRSLSAGGYTAVLSNNTDSAGETIVEAYAVDGDGDAEGRLINLSANKQFDADNTSLTAGFVISGNVPKKVLIRAVGPSLEEFIGNTFLPDPTLTLNRLIGAHGEPAGVVLTNDDWQKDGEWMAVQAAAASSGAFPLIADSADASVLVTLTPGNYTVQVDRKDDQSGLALIEVYEVE